MTLRRPPRLGPTTGLALVALLPLALAAGAAGSGRAADDDDEKAESRQLGEQAFRENCLMCHGADMTTRQRLTPKQWAAEVEKMVGWGTPLPPERKDDLVAWLVESFPTTRAAAPVERITPEAALADAHQGPFDPTAPPGADPAHGSALFAQHCAACHGPAARGGAIGVNLVARPVLLRAGEFRATLDQGRRRMPSFAPVLDPRAQDDLLAWLRRQQ